MSPTTQATPRQREALLVAEGLTRRFGGLTANSKVNLTLEKGTLHALLGPNGAGKSTCINMLSGDLPPSEGRILLGGKGFAVAGGHCFFALFHGDSDNPACARIVRQFSSQISRQFRVGPFGRMEFQTLRFQFNQLHIMHHLRGQNHRPVLFQKPDNVGKCSQIGISNGCGLRGRDGGQCDRR